MQQSESIAAIAKALSAAQGDCASATKDKTNPFFKSKYATLEEIIAVLKEPLKTNSLSVTQFTDFDANGIWVETQITHASGEWMRGRYPVFTVDNKPQTLGSAISYAKRYSLQAALLVPSEDDDGNVGSGKNPLDQSGAKGKAIAAPRAEESAPKAETNQPAKQAGDVPGKLQSGLAPAFLGNQKPSGSSPAITGSTGSNVLDKAISEIGPQNMGKPSKKTGPQLPDPSFGPLNAPGAVTVDDVISTKPITPQTSESIWAEVKRQGLMLGMIKEEVERHVGKGKKLADMTESQGIQLYAWVRNKDPKNKWLGKGAQK